MEKHFLYNKTICLNFDSVKHHYTVNGVTVDGVTSILGAIAKPALIAWAANKASEYVNHNLPVGQVVDEVMKKNLVNGCKSAHRVFKENAADMGTLLHQLIEKYIKKESYQEPVNEILKKSFEQFKNWVKENDVQFKSSERRIYSKKYNYAGTMDFSAVIKGKRIIGDLKTSSGIWPEYRLQLSAYKQALQEEFPDLPVSHLAIIRCGKDGSFEVQEFNDFEKNMRAFLGALALYRWQKNVKFETLTI